MSGLFHVGDTWIAFMTTGVGLTDVQIGALVWAGAFLYGAFELLRLLVILEREKNAG